ncbi:MAG: zinc ribbon domain-containing protein [Candidatus Heimdallarchaeaceae archaeon]
MVLAYIFLAVETIMLMIIPANVLLTATGEVNPDYKTYYFVLYFVDIFYDVSFVLGYWNIRKNFVVLDKIPKEYFEKKQAQEAYRDIYQPRYLIADQKPIDENLGTGETKDDSIIDTTSEKVDVKKKKKFCTKCGLELEDDAVFCPNCGERNYYD